MALEPWEVTILDLALGSLLSGFLLFFFSIFTAGFHFGHGGHGGHVGHTSHTGHLGHWFHINNHFHFGHHLHIGHSGHSHVNAHKSARLDQNPSTPILLILAAFLLMFGAIGTVVYQLELFDPLFRIVAVFIAPIVFVKFVTIAWGKITGNEFGYNIPFVSVDNEVLTLTNVDEQGGLVLAETGTLDDPKTLHTKEKMKMHAKTLPGVCIERNTVAYVIEIDMKNTLIIDSWPRLAKKEITQKN